MQEELFGHPYAFTSIIVITAFIIYAGMFGRYIARATGQVSVLGEIFAGIIIGNVGYWYGGDIFFLIMHLDRMSQIVSEVWNSGDSLVEATRRVFHLDSLLLNTIPSRLDAAMSGHSGALNVVTAVTLWVFSNLGAHFLILMVGVKSNISHLRRFGNTATKVALIGVFAPFSLGYAAVWALLPDSSFGTHLFAAAALCGTSIGISARVFRDLQKEKTNEARIVLGAAVLDSILLLIILAIIVGIATTNDIDQGKIIRICILSTAFFGTILVLGEPISHLTIRVFQFLDPHTCKLVFPIFLLCALAWLAEQIGLAAIIGAFAAGLILDDKLFHRYRHPGPRLETVLKPLESTFSPVFFVLIGMQVDLTLILEPGVIPMVIGLSIAAMAGKTMAGFAARNKADWLSVGIAMNPRGEVTLLVAGVGKSLGVFPLELFAAIVLMTILTSALATLALRWSLFR